MPKKRTRVRNLCGQCMKVIPFGLKAGIKHFKLNHPTMPENCYEAYGDTSGSRR